MGQALIDARLKTANGPEPVRLGSTHSLMAYLREGDFSAGRDDWLTNDQPGSARLTFKNEDGRFAPLRSDSPYYSNVDAMRSVFVRMATGHTLLGGQAETASVLANSPTIFWLLKEPSGTSATDSSGNSRTGTYNGSLASANEPSPAMGYPTDLRPFDGSNDNVTHTSSGITSRSHTLWGEAWFCTASNANQSGYIFKIGSHPTGFGVGIGSGDLDTDGRELIVEFAGVRWITGSNASSGPARPISITPGWHHVLVALDPDGNAYCFLDGDMVFADIGNTDCTAPDANVYVGGYTAGGNARWFAGWVYGFACGNAQLGRDSAEARCALVGRAVFAGVIAGATPDPHPNVRRATIALNDSLQWLVRDDRQPTYTTGDARANMELALAAASWPVTMWRSTAAFYGPNLSVAPSFGTGTSVYNQLKSLAVDHEGGRLYGDPEGSLVFEAAGSTIFPDNNNPYHEFDNDFVGILPTRNYQNIFNRIRLSYNGGSTTVNDTTSQGKYGLALKSISATFLDSTQGADRADGALAALKDPHDQVTVLLTGGTVATLREIIVRQPSHRITLVNADTGIDGDYKIMSRHVAWDEGGFVTARWECAPW